MLRYRSIGGCYILIADPAVLQGGSVRANIVWFHSSQTKRVCRSTLPAAASHLPESFEAGDWIAVLLHEALHGDVDLKNWPHIIEQRERIYVTDARSVFDYLSKDATSTSSDERMAIEGALLRETVRRRKAHVRWIDGQQSMSNILTKAGADKQVLLDFLKDGMFSLVQTESNRLMKERQRLRRSQQKKDRSVRTPLMQGHEIDSP